MKNNMKLNYTYFVLGIIISALGISLITKVGLGTSAIASPAYVLSHIFPFSFGTFSFAVSCVMILIEIAIQKKNFPIVQYLQFPAGLLLGVLIDFYMLMMQSWLIDDYMMKIIVLLIGCAVLGLGVAFQVKGNVLMLPAEGLVRVLAEFFHKEFGEMKTIFDVVLVTMSIILSFLFLNLIIGVREGTVITALTTGMFSKFFIKKIMNRLP